MVQVGAPLQREVRKDQVYAITGERQPFSITTDQRLTARLATIPAGLTQHAVGEVQVDDLRLAKTPSKRPAGLSRTRSRHGAGTGSAAPASFVDPEYDAANDAFLITSFNYSTMGDPSDAGLWLQIGQSGLNCFGGRSADVDVVFGDPNDPALNGEGNRLVSSATVDAVSLQGRFPGDANGDSAVNLLDFQILNDNFGITGSGTFDMGDFNGDRNIDILDFGILQENYGAELPVPVSAFANAQVPEPSTIFLTAIGLLVFTACGLRRHRVISAPLP